MCFIPLFRFISKIGGMLINQKKKSTNKIMFSLKLEPTKNNFMRHNNDIFWIECTYLLKLLRL